MTVYWDRLAPGDQWDQHMLEKLLAGELYPHGLDIQKADPDTSAGLVILIPGRYYQPEQITKLVDGLPWVLAIRTGDEEDTLDPSRVVHPNIKWWVQTPRFTETLYPAGTRFIPLGFPPHFSEKNPSPPPAEFMTEVFLSAQDTHQRRHECFAALDHLDPDKNLIRKTEGFTQGLSTEMYRSAMEMAKVAPCPAGPASPDTFRVYEALEAHAIPIADDITPAYKETGYWRDLFRHDAPFPVITNYESLPDYIETALAGWPDNANRITAWWMQTKRKLALALVEDLTALGALDG